MFTRTVASHFDLLDHILSPLYDDYVTPRTRDYIKKRNRRKFLRENFQYYQKYGYLYAKGDATHWHNLFALPAEYTSTSTPTSSPHYLKMPEITKVFDSVDKLKADGSNYRLWIARVKACVRACQASTLLTAAAGDANQALKVKNDEIVAALFSKLPEDIFVKVMEQENTHEILRILDRDYNIVTHTVQAVTEAQLYSLKCSHDRDIDKHIDAMLDIRNKMAEQGRQIDDVTFINALSASVNESYRDVIQSLQQNLAQANAAAQAQTQAIRTSLQAIPNFAAANLPTYTARTLTATEVVNALRQKAASKAAIAKSSQVKKKDEKEGQANYSSSGKGNQRFQGRGKNYNRGNQNNNNNNNNRNRGNQSKQNNNNANSNQRGDRQCYNCKGYGHMSKDCSSPRKQRGGRANEAQAQTTTSKPKQETPSARIEEIGSVTDLQAEGWITMSANDVAAAKYSQGVFDTGATIHCTPRFKDLTHLRRTDPFPIRTANGKIVHSTVTGDLIVTVPNGTTTSHIQLSDVRYHPSFTTTLISSGKLDETGYAMHFAGGRLRIYDPSGKLIGNIRKRHGLWATDWSTDSTLATTTADHHEDTSSWPKLSLYELHERLGHINYAYIKRMIATGSLRGLRLDPENKSEQPCIACTLAKIKRSTIPQQRQAPVALHYGDHFHMDIWGPAKVQTPSHGLYVLTIIDDATRWCHMFIMKHKSDSLATYVQFQTWLKTQYSITIKKLQSDNDSTFTSHEFKQYIDSQGTNHITSVHDTPQHNGTAERVQGTIIQCVRTNLTSSKLPLNLWGECIKYALYVYNRAPHSALKFQSPFIARFGTIPDLSCLYKFGQQCVVRLESADKLTERGVQCRWLAPDDSSTGYRVYWPNERKVSTERNIRMLFGIEEEKLDTPQPLVDIGPPGNASTTPSTATIPADDSGQPLATRRTRRTITAPERLTYDSVRLAEAWIASGGDPLGDPLTIAEVNRRSDADQWYAAMETEVSSLIKHGTWEYVYPPSHANLTGLRFVFRTKRRDDGSIDKFKARLVVQGYTQVEGVDYYADDTRAPVARLSTIRAILAYAAKHDWEIHQIDIKSAYLYGKLDDDEVIYARPPAGYTLPGIKPGQVIRLRKALYGLKQAGRRWYQVLCKILESAQLTRTDKEEALFFRHHPNGHITLTMSWVDDLFLVSSKPGNCAHLKKIIGEQVEFTDGGEVSWALGMEIKRDRSTHTIALRQLPYIETIITRYGFDDAAPSKVPAKTSTVLSSDLSPTTQEEKAEMEKRPYRAAVGALRYAADVSRPDIAFIVGQLARYMINPGQAHWTALKCVFQYLKQTKHKWLILGGQGPDELDGYTDSDGMSTEGRRPISGYIFRFCNSPISWSSKRQELVTLSTAEAEYVALTYAGREAIWLKDVLSQALKLKLTPITLRCDNTSAVSISKDDVFHARTKHIDIYWHWIRQQVSNGTIHVEFVSTHDNVADIMTKALPEPKVNHFVDLLQLRA